MGKSIGKRTAITLGLAFVLALLSPLPAPADIVATGGSVVEVSPPPSVVKNAFTNDTQISAFDEQLNVVTSAPITVDFTQPGTYDNLENLSPVEIPAGTCVQSHFLHLDSTGSLGVRLQGSATYDTDVLGVIVTDASLDQSDPVVGSPSTAYPTGTGYRGAEFLPLTQSDPDVVTLGSDLRTVGVDLKVTVVVNQVRVITRCRDVADLALTKSDSPDPVTAGDDVDYAVTVTNNGLTEGTGNPSAATGITVVDTIPAASTYVSVSASGWTCGAFDSGAGTLTCTLDSPLAVGDSATFDVVVASPTDGGAITNSAVVTADQFDPNAADNTATATTTVVLPPGAPTDVGGDPGNASAVVTWTPPASEGDSPIDFYEVTCTATGNPLDAHVVDTNDATPAAQVTELTNGVEYSCTVRAHNGAGFGPSSDPSAPFTPSDTQAAELVDPSVGGSVDLFPDQSSEGTSGQLVLPAQPAAMPADSPIVVTASLFGHPGDVDPTCGGKRCVGQGIEYAISDPGAFATIQVIIFESRQLVGHRSPKSANVYKNGVRLCNCQSSTNPGRRGACVLSRLRAQDGGWMITILASGTDPKMRV